MVHSRLRPPLLRWNDDLWFAFTVDWARYNGVEWFGAWRTADLRSLSAPGQTLLPESVWKRDRERQRNFKIESKGDAEMSQLSLSALSQTEGVWQLSARNSCCYSPFMVVVLLRSCVCPAAIYPLIASFGNSKRPINRS